MRVEHGEDFSKFLIGVASVDGPNIEEDLNLCVTMSTVGM